MSVATTDEERTESAADLPLRDQLRILFSASRAFWLVNLVNFADGIAYFGILTLLTRFLGTRIHLGDVGSGLSVTVFTGAVSLFMIGGGGVSDRLGVRRALTWSLGIIGLGRLLLTVSPGFGAHAALGAWAALLLMALGTGVLQPALYAGVKEFTDSRTASIGYGILYSVMNLGIVGENFLSPWIRTDAVFADNDWMRIVGLGWGIDGVYWFCVSITGLMLLIHLTFFTRRLEETEHVVEASTATEGETSADVERRESPFRNVRFMYFIFILLPVRTLFAHQWLTVPDYVFRCFPYWVSARFEWISGINPLIIVVGVPLVAALTRRFRVIDMMIVGTSVTALTTFMLVGPPNLAALLWYVVLFSVGEALWSSRFLEYVADLAPAGKVGAYMGLANLPWFFAKFTTGLYSGLMLATFIPDSTWARAWDVPKHPETLWLIYACIACLSPIGLILARRWIIAGQHEGH